MKTSPRTLRRRKKPSLLARVRVFWLLIVVILAGIGYGAYSLASLPQLRVHAILVNVSGDTVTEAAVLDAAHIDRDANAWLLDTRAIATRIEAIPYVARAHVSRRLPATIAITVTERVPFACVHDGTRIVTIDDTPRILQEGCAVLTLPQIDARNAPLDVPGKRIDDADITTLLADLGTLAAAHVTVRSVSHDRFDGLDAVDPLGVRLRFGSDADLAKKAALVGPVRAATRSSRKIRVIDLRAPGTPIVEFE